MQTTHPQPGQTYYAPIALTSRWPLVFGERCGIVIDEESQTAGVVYTSREAAEAARADPAVWARGNAARTRVAALTYRGDLMPGLSGFAFATAAEMIAHEHAVTNR